MEKGFYCLGVVGHRLGPTICYLEEKNVPDAHMSISSFLDILHLLDFLYLLSKIFYCRHYNLSEV